jgi:hypothetical protein
MADAFQEGREFERGWIIQRIANYKPVLAAAADPDASPGGAVARAFDELLAILADDPA